MSDELLHVGDRVRVTWKQAEEVPQAFCEPRYPDEKVYAMKEHVGHGTLVRVVMVKMDDGTLRHPDGFWNIEKVNEPSDSQDSTGQA